MKKKIVNVLLTAAVITSMMLSVTACGSKSDDAQDAALPAATQQDAEEPVESTVEDIQESTAADGDEETTEDAETTEEETDELTVSAEGAMTLEEWTNSDECAQFSEMMNQGLDGMTISFEVEGDTISMIFTMTEEIDVAEDAEEAMAEYFENNSAIFEAIRDQLISETGNENTVLSLIYRNADGSDIFGMDF